MRNHLKLFTSPTFMGNCHLVSKTELKRHISAITPPNPSNSNEANRQHKHAGFDLFGQVDLPGSKKNQRNHPQYVLVGLVFGSDANISW